ncbi:MFS transporter [Streptomyces sp. NBC_01304]|uniref:MFS transporter n=1 Tax=Streptomyces sp. NBC_01304 TaxID=2903818 RepID=UPI002E127E3D|nr:MFS transporter [Streptomyces sp. NBC_01304]
MSDTADLTSLDAGLQPSADVRRARWLLTGYFAAQGVVMATWATRLPAVKEAADLSPGALSLGLLAAALGMVSTLLISGRIAEHHRGTPRLLVGSACVLGMALIALGQCRSLVSLIAAAGLFGAAQGLLLVPMNASGVACQTGYGRPIMSTLHGSYSVGAFSGAGISTATAGHLSHSLAFSAVGATVVVAALLAAPITLKLPDPQPAPDAPEAPTVRGKVWLLGAMIAAGLIAEGTALDWSAVHVRSLGAGATTAAGAYWLYGAGMATGRLMGDVLTVRFGSTKLLRTGATVAAVGLGVGLAATSTPAAAPIALIGWALLGLGVSPIVPLLYSAAGSYGPRAVASVGTIGNVGLLGGPVAIGAIASTTTLPLALTVPVLLAAAIAVGARVVTTTR